MKQKIIVLGGSFNPPTIAHQTFLLSAIDALGADLGIFVPAPYPYVKKKMTKTPYPYEVVDEKIRMDMLLAMCAEDPRLRADDLEYHRKGMTYTYHTLEALQKKYPDAELYFLAGADKLKIIPKWGYIEEFLKKFHIIVTDRDGTNAWAEIEADKILCKYKEHFRLIPLADDLSGISATAAREALRNGEEETLRSLLHPAAFQIIQDKKIYTIDQFRDKYFFLSNFAPSPITYQDISYLNAEAAFQAQKCLSEEEKIDFTNLSADEAKKLGKKVTLREDWKEVRISVMEEIVREKFLQNPSYANALAETGTLDLKEGNHWNDTFWGVGSQSGEGENHLGRILMKIRAELLASSSFQS